MGIEYISSRPLPFYLQRTLFIMTIVITEKIVKSSIRSAQKSGDCVFLSLTVII